MIQNPIPWPGGAKVAVAITFDMDADSLIHIEKGKAGVNYLSTISMLRYGPDVAIPRILNGYKRFGLTQTFFIPAWCIEQHPKAVEAIVEGGHEVGFHGYIHEAPNALPPEEERYWMQRSIEVIETFTGKRPRGNRSPLYNMSAQTPDLLAEAGFLYDSSLMGDDVPYMLATPKGELVELPVSWATDDWPPYVHSIDLDYMFQLLPPDRAMEVFMAEFNAMRRAGGGLWIGVWHPFVSGRLSRWQRIEQMIQEMQETGEVWFATLEQIANHCLTLERDGALKLRRQDLPHYGGQSPLPDPRPFSMPDG
ncbi:polysaccharide deacetylase [Actibacterium sp. 188UL27-1]|uniref:polysaccharide deacetylase family protein n=1 Tax=Actibacterium sp. 188UL27-1 TaxID=2786961 RepID=UPI00195E7A46|nr:polysaccharide deacetylase [Actibacterium sp. 188UL27-1]MBM7067198.1 polysaccharide deacetylase [Actibacterium sp. 188UL27-1]